MMIRPRDPRKGDQSEVKTWEEFGFNLEPNDWGNSPYLTGEEVDKLTFCCCECCNKKSCLSGLSELFCDKFPNTSTANQFFTPLQFSAYHREGYRACIEAQAAEFLMEEQDIQEVWDTQARLWACSYRDIVCKCRCFHAYKTSTRVKGLSPSTLSKSAVFVKKTALEPSRSLAQFPWHKATRSINTFPPDVMLIYRRITPQHFIRLPSKFTGTLESKMFCPRTQHNDQVSNPVLSNCFPPHLPLGILATHHCLPM